MKNAAKIFSIVLFLTVRFVLVSSGNQKAEWRGKVETENDVRVIENPEEPLYGEILF